MVSAHSYLTREMGESILAEPAVLFDAPLLFAVLGVLLAQKTKLSFCFEEQP